MNPVQLHLMMNHVPVIGIPIVILILAVALFQKSRAILRLGLAILVLLALAALPAYLSGEPAEHAVEKIARLSETAVESHEDAAKLSFLGVEILGLAALAGLIAFRRREIPASLTLALLAVALVVGGSFARTAHLGGQIRHEEIRAGALTDAGAAVEESEAAKEDERD